MSDRRKLTAQALRAMADRVEKGKVNAYEMQTFVEVMYPTITFVEEMPYVEHEPKSIWKGLIRVILPEGVLDD